MSINIKRVLYISPMPPMQTGIADYAFEFKKALENEGFEIIVFKGKTGRLDTGCTKSDIKKFLLNSDQIATHKKNPYDLIYAELGSEGQYEYWYLRILKKIFPDVPTGFTIHDPPSLVKAGAELFLNSGKIPFKRKVSRIFDKVDYCRMFHYPLIKRSFVNVLTKKGQKKITEVYPDKLLKYKVNYLPQITYYPLMEGKQSGQKIYFFGFWGPSKGLDILIDAFSLIGEQYKGTELFLTGSFSKVISSSDSYKIQIENKIEKSPCSDRIHLLGHLTQEQLQAHLLEANIVVLPYRQSGDQVSASGIAARALIAGCTLVVSDAGGLSEYVWADRNGYVFTAGNSTDLANCLKKILENPQIQLNAQVIAKEYLESTSPKFVAAAFKEGLHGFFKTSPSA